LKNYKICILCGGKGERLKPITNNVPKPLVKINNKTILSYIIDHFLMYKVKDFTIATGYKSEMIEEFLLKKYQKCNFEFSNSGDVDIVKRLSNIKLDNSKKLIVCYGDTIANVNLDELIKFHIKKKSKATVSTYEHRSQFGLFRTDDRGLIERYDEKPIIEGRINIGFFVLDNQIAKRLSSHVTFKDFISDCVKKRILYNYKHDGYHITVNSHNELKAAEKRIHKLSL